MKETDSYIIIGKLDLNGQQLFVMKHSNETIVIKLVRKSND